MNVVAIANAMNVATAASERRDRRPRPQTPWPLVHPLPRRVPNPTRKPAASRSGAGAVCVRGGAGTNCSAIAPAITRPARNASRQARSPRAPSMAPVAMPLMPAILPMDHSSRTAASPIRTPPASAEAHPLMKVERVMGIEPTLAAWEAAVLPLNYTRLASPDFITSHATLHVRAGGRLTPTMDHGTPLIATIVGGLGLAFLFGALANRLRMSPIVGYLLAGVAVGPFTPGFVADQSIANELAEIGVILLMFGVGMHFSFRDLLAVRTIALPGAVVQIGAATLMGVG